MESYSTRFVLLLLYIPFQNVYAATPGVFYWKPRLGIDLAEPSTETPSSFNAPTREAVERGVVVMINGYDAGMTLMAILAGITNSDVYPTLNPIAAPFYTNAYRWALRHFSMMPHFLGGSKSYVDTTRVWRRRFYYMDTFIPEVLKKVLLPYVKKEDWEKEEREMLYFKRFSESAFGKGYRYPTKSFNNFLSWETEESMDNLDISSLSLTLG